MKPIVRFLLRSSLFLGLLLAIDQVVVHVPMDLAGLREGRDFYLDFRHRLLNLDTDQTSAPSTIDTAIDTPQNQGKGRSPRYLYADDAGQLYFTDTLDQIPLSYRAQAQLLDD